MPGPVVDDAGTNWVWGGLMRVESAVRTTGQENIVNQRGTPFNGKPVQRDSTAFGGSPDVWARTGKEGDNAFNLMQLRGQLDITGQISTKVNVFARIRGIYDVAPYDEFDLDAVDSRAVGNDYQAPEYFENRIF